MILPRELASIRARFTEAGLELVLERGTVIGVQCCVQFHEVHGLSLIVRDMDPSFVVGELELRRRRILQGLKRDELLSHNARWTVPLFPTRILLITSGASAAYHDFTRTLLQRKFGLRLWLADATMQGPSTEASVLRALALADKLPIDLVVLIRGGGSKLDLGWLDWDKAARAIASLQRPVWTGIGHEIDTSVVDFVAAKAFRTPTAVTEALCTHLEALERRLEDSEARMRKACLSALQLQQEKLGRATHTLRQRPGAFLQMRRAELGARANQLSVRVTRRVSTARAAWRSRADRMQRSVSVLLLDSSRRLQRSRDRLIASAPLVTAEPHRGGSAAQQPSWPETGRLDVLPNISQREPLPRHAGEAGSLPRADEGVCGAPAALQSATTGTSCERSSRGLCAEQGCGCDDSRSADTAWRHRGCRNGLRHGASAAWIRNPSPTAPRAAEHMPDGTICRAFERTRPAACERGPKSCEQANLDRIRHNEKPKVYVSSWQP